MKAGSVTGLAGTLLSGRAAKEWLDTLDTSPHETAAKVAEWASLSAASLGPASPERRLLESLEVLFEGALGFTCRRADGHAVAMASGQAVVLFACPWARPLTLGSRRVLLAALDAGAAWAAGFNGISLGIGDARAGSPRRTWSVGLDALAAHADTAQFTAAVLDARLFAEGALAGAIAASDASSLETRHGLRAGVHTALDALTGPLPFDASLAVLFRLLFVLFAEARSLVPVWHGTYRDHYSLAAVAGRWTPRDPGGAWASLEAVRRLLGDGCRAGTLRIAGFNGRLFAPGPRRKWARSARLDSDLDRPAAEALAALLEYQPSRGGARRVNYAELDVEELGSIYERVLDLDPAGAGRVRKESGSFYTPRALTGFLVRRALTPLVDGASSSRILSLRIVDPAMGSGAFLVAALRFLAAALERALIDEGKLPEHDVTDEDRRQLRRRVARHCLYGVDVNPTAVMLAKLSLWLATLSAGKPLGFLDHRLKCGDALAGADPLSARIAPRMARAAAALPLFDATRAEDELRAQSDRAGRLARMSEESLADIRRKQRTFESMSATDAARWRALCDAWCAWWFAPASSRPDAREFRALAATLVSGSTLLSRRGAGRRLRDAAAIAASARFFHWALEYPEVFGSGEAGGFDAVIGNPPWEMLRAGAGSGARGPLNAFVRGSGLYPLAASGHVNLYQLFLERALQIARPGGRIGLVMPWGLMSDDGSAALRGALFDGTRIDTLARFDNREAIFQAHRSLRFAALTATTGGATEAIELTRAARASLLDDLPDSGPTGSGPLLTRRALQTAGGAARRVPDVGSARELAILVKVSAAHRALGDPAGWGASFGRELNLTDDRRAFTRSGLPVLEGKHLHPHRVDLAGIRHRISRAHAVRLLPSRPFDRPRLAYRDVTAPTNVQTLIAAIVPADVVTSHSLFCLRNHWDAATQRALCVLLNSAVANFLIRLFVGSHVTTSLIEWLPVPDREQVVAALARATPGRPGTEEMVARLYGLTKSEFEAVV